MPTVSQLLKKKSTWNEGDFGSNRIERIQTISQACTALDAAKLMNEHRVGSLIVIDGFDDMIGIITERDLLMRVIAEERQPSETTISSIMTKDIVSCRPETKLAEVRKVMRDCRIRHIPVIDDTVGKGSIVGMVSIGDLNAANNADLMIEVKSMREYITQGG
ncbi:MAG: CBS domain-containing protein [Phycisphaerales bacterium]